MNTKFIKFLLIPEEAPHKTNPHDDNDFLARGAPFLNDLLDPFKLPVIICFWRQGKSLPCRADGDGRLKKIVVILSIWFRHFISSSLIQGQ